MNDKSKKKKPVELEPHEFIHGMMHIKIYSCDNDEWLRYWQIWKLCENINSPLIESHFDENGKESIANPCHKSIIKFPTFLLNCYRLWIAERENVSDILAKIPHTADNLLEYMWHSKSNKHAFLLSYRDKNDYKDFIETMFYYRVLFDCFVIRGKMSAIVGGWRLTELAKMQSELKYKCDKNGWGYRWLWTFLYHLRLECDIIKPNSVLEFATYKNLTYPSHRANLINFMKNIIANISDEIEHRCVRFLLRLNSDGFLSKS